MGDYDDLPMPFERWHAGTMAGITNHWTQAPYQAVTGQETDLWKRACESVDLASLIAGVFSLDLRYWREVESRIETGEVQSRRHEHRGRIKAEIANTKKRLRYLESALAVAGNPIWIGDVDTELAAQAQRRALRRLQLEWDLFGKGIRPDHRRAQIWGYCDITLKNAGWSDAEIAELILELPTIFPEMGDRWIEAFFGRTLDGKPWDCQPPDRVREVRKNYRKVRAKRFIDPDVE